MKTKNKLGFTLLELLVVVLIIGILAAVALPQYQLAVDKAELSTYQAMVSSLRNAYYEYLLIHDRGPETFEDISLDIMNDFTDYYYNSTYKFSCISNATTFCCISGSNANIYGLINCGKKDLSFAYQESYLNQSNILQKVRGTCEALENNKRAERLCASFGPYSHKTNILTPQGLNNTYNAHKYN